MAKMRAHILPFDCTCSNNPFFLLLSLIDLVDTKLKNFKFDMSKGVQEENDIIPPPQWTHQTLPFNYSSVGPSYLFQTVYSRLTTNCLL